MKTTNFEISKKLKEIGFVHCTDFYHIADEKCKSRGEDPYDYELEYISMFSEESYKLKKHYNIPSYDLETLFNALPTSIEKNGKVYLRFLHHNVLGYYATSNKLDYGNIRLWDNIFELYNHSKSLADTAGRLLIQLFEARIINFNK